MGGWRRRRETLPGTARYDAAGRPRPDRPAFEPDWSCQQGPFGPKSSSVLRRATWSRPEAERRAVAGVRLAALRDGNRALDERSGDAGLLAVPPDPFRQQLVPGGRGRLLRQPVVIHVGE